MGTKKSFHARAYPYVDFDSTVVFRSQVVGFIKGKSAIHMARRYFGRKKKFTGQNLGWRISFSTAVREEEAIRKNIKEQEREDRRIDQLNLFK